MHRPPRLAARAFPRLFRPLHTVRFLLLVILTAAVSIPVLAVEESSLRNVEPISKHPVLQPFDVSGKDLPQNLFLVKTRGELPVASGISVHGEHDGVFLVSGKPKVIQELTKKGCAIISLKNLPTPPAHASRSWTRIDSPNPDIQNMVDQVNWPDVSDKIENLVDFGTRYSFAPNHQTVAQSLRDELESYGLQVVFRPFRYMGMTMYTVEATQVGTKYPNSYVVISGHFDSISDDPMVSAPGADDNATGTAAVLTTAEILSQHEFDYSIRYICFAGEELGLVGSYFYAWEAQMNNMDIVGLLNFDMLGYWEPGVDRDLEIETNHASQWLAEAVINAVDLYTDTPYELHVYDWAWWGDHFWFWMNGYSAVNHEEAWDWYDPDFNPHYHSTTDLPEYVHPDFTVDNVKVGVAAIATLADAGPAQTVSFDMQPGSCPNPFNPKSNGVTNALILGSPDLDVRGIIPASVHLENFVSPSKIRVGDMASFDHDNGHPCADMSTDGFDDLSLKFPTGDIADLIGKVKKGDAVTIHLTARLHDGTVIEGEDIVIIVGNNDDLAGAQSFDLPPDENGTSGAPEKFALHQNHPNPFNPTTTIQFDVPPGGGIVTLRVYDVGGRLVRSLVNGEQTAGQKAIRWDGKNDAGNAVATGAYLYRLTGPGFEQTRKMILLK